MEELSKYQKLQQKYRKKIGDFVTNNKHANEIFHAFEIGQNKYLKSSRKVSSNLETKWLSMIEDCLLDLGDIVNNPKKTTKTVTDIVPVELAKKTNSESIRHLASHTQYVKSVDKKGNVTPNKVLNIATEDEYITYENKFIATLIRKLVLFVEKRYEYAKEFMELSNVDVMLHKSTVVVDGSIVEVETKVRVTKSTESGDENESFNYIKRIDEIRKYIMYYNNSDFMKMFKGERMVHGQILQTNIIRKNPKYNKCYKLYRYIETYSSLGINYKVKETYADLTKDEIREMNEVAFHAFLAAGASDPAKVKLAEQREYKPRVLKTIDDDLFVYGELSNKPLVFVRADDEYFEQQKREAGEIKRFPTKKEAEYQADNVQKKKKVEDEEAKVKALLKRKEKEAKEFAKTQERLKLEEEKRQQMLKEQEEKEKLARTSKLIESAREDLKDSALDKEEKKEEPPSGDEADN